MPTTLQRCTLLALLCACAATPSPSVTSVESFRAARAAGDLEAARTFLADDARRWWGEREGQGAPWTLGTGGPWTGWDAHFNGTTERAGPWRREGDTVFADFFEVNDYFLLTERGGGFWRGTYFFDRSGKIAGFMISSAPGREDPQGRGKEFKAWAFEHHPEEAEHLMPEGSIDPTGDRPQRMRTLLGVWRREVGLPAIE